jgi:nicotinamide-nucleotide amidase
LKNGFYRDGIGYLRLSLFAISEKSRRTKVAMRAEIISIGDELTSGQRLDTNSQWLSTQLSDLGVSTVFHTTIGDSMADNIDAFQTAARRVDLVVSTGGLGPTADDLTREAMSEAFGKPLEIRQEALEHIEGLFARRRRPMPERNRIQAMFPIGSTIIPNPHGTAPGIDMTVDGPCRFFALPGVPAEMMQMWNETVFHRIIGEMGAGKKRWFYRTLKVFGIGESDVEAKLPDLIRRDRIPRVGITVSKATITLRIACLASTEAEAVDASQATEQEIRESLGELVFGHANQELDDVVHAKLQDLKQTLGVVEYGGVAIVGPWLAVHASGDTGSGEIGSGDTGLSVYGLKESRWYRSIRAAATAIAPDGVASADETDWAARAQLHQTVATAAQKTMSTDWLLMLGPYPNHSEIQDAVRMPTCEFVITLVSPKGEVRCEKFELGGHPEIVFARLAKAGLDYFRRHAN